MIREALLAAAIACLPLPALAGPLVFGGDVTLNYNMDPGQREFFGKKARKYLDGADLFVWNAEFAGDSGAKKDKRFVFSGPHADVAPFAFRNGIAMVSNNHSLDGGKEGFDNLLRALDDAGIIWTGARHPDPEGNFTMVPGNGRRIFVLSAAPMFAESPLITSYDDLKRSLAAIEKKPGDLIIVNLHEGAEGTKLITANQRRRAEELSRMGADIVSFTHTHTYIDPEYIGDTLVLWGVGNFIFGGKKSWRNNDDVRLVEVDPDTLEWKWVRGRTRNYVFELK